MLQTFNWRYPVENIQGFYLNDEAGEKGCGYIIIIVFRTNFDLLGNSQY